jgi:hypothetical protein
VTELDRSPARFSSYCFPLFRFAKENRFRYPYREWPESAALSSAQESTQDSERHVSAGECAK